MAWRRWLRARWPWLAAVGVLLTVAIVFVQVTGMRPAYDAYGWLVWGRQAAHLHLNTNAAPSWKPLTFLFTFSYVLIAGATALWLWMVTAVAAALGASLFAGRIAYRLAGPLPGHPHARMAGAVFAGLAVLGIEGYWHFILIAVADPMITMLCLAGIDCHLSGRRRLAWLLFVLTALGRPEAWAATALYGVWAWRAIPSMRRLILFGLAVVPALWFGIPALTSHSPLIAGDIASGSTKPLTGNRFFGALRGFAQLYEFPMQLAALCAAALAIWRREVTWLLLMGGAILWVLTEGLFALHGWAAAPRYMFEPEAVAVTLVGALLARLLALPVRRASVIRWAAVAAVAALVVALVPHARTRARLAHNGILLGRTWARQIHRLDEVIAADGGPKRILACGQAVTTVPFQSILAWAMHENVADIGWAPHAWVRRGKPIVLFQPLAAGWEVRPFHIAAAKRDACARLQTHSAFG